MNASKNSNDTTNVVPDTSQAAIVAIGRNEGERLKRCIASAQRASPRVVYVDSGSTDGSVVWARAQGVEVVELDMRVPFSAARARNAGFARVREAWPGVSLVQFVDGDCEFFDGWIAAACAHLRSHERVAAVCGRVRERHPERSVYNRLCDLEWAKPVGAVPACGGIFMIRVEAFAQVDGFNDSVVAGEEPEMCLRLRRAGWTIASLAADMVWHDAAMVRFGQWWKRSVRGGYAYAMGRALHGRGPERFCVRQSQRIWLWACWLPVVALAAAWWTWGLSIALLVLLYAAQTARTAMRKRGEGVRTGDAWLYAFFAMLAKWPQLVGQVRFYRERRRGHGPRIIEYKMASTDDAPRDPGAATDRP